MPSPSHEAFYGMFNYVTTQREDFNFACLFINAQLLLGNQESSSLGRC